jgi:ketosteroid isomerase-like protein
MTKRFAVMALLVLAGARAGAQPMAPSPQFQASMDLASAMRARDVAKMLGLMASDVVLLPPGRDLAGGQREVEAMVKDFFGKNTVEIAFSSLGSSAADKLGFDVGQYELTVKPEGGGAKVKTRGKYLALYRQGEDDKWRLAYLSWNGSEGAAAAASPAPAASPAAAPSSKTTPPPALLAPPFPAPTPSPTPRPPQ